MVGMDVSARWKFAPGTDTGLWGLASLSKGRAFLDGVFGNGFSDRWVYFSRNPSAAALRGLADYPDFMETVDVADEIAETMEPGLILFETSSLGIVSGPTGRASVGSSLGLLGKKLFSKGGTLNSNRYLRIGFGRKGGVQVFRVAGSVVQKVFRREHIDLWTGGKL